MHFLKRLKKINTYFNALLLRYSSKGRDSSIYLFHTIINLSVFIVYYPIVTLV